LRGLLIASETPLEDDMLGYSFRTPSPQENRRGSTPLPAWDQAIVLSNRGPLIQERAADGSIRTRRSSGGLVTALDPLVQACSGTWVASGTQAGDTCASTIGGIDVRYSTAGYRLRQVCLSEEEYRGYYYGFANEGLWPLCHAVGVEPVFRSNDFLAYRSANTRFATAVADEATCAAPLLLVQDYHFALAPRELRHRLPLSTVVTFWHIPWPSFHALRTCPWARDLLHGMLGSDIAGFQTVGDCARFLNCAESFLGAQVNHDSGTVTYRGQQTRVREYPVGIEWDSKVVQATPPANVCRDRVRCELALSPDVKLGVGIDRLDYTKGINQKLLAVERTLERRPELIGRFAFVQVAEPSRDCLPEYRSAREQIVATARRVNERFGNGKNQPILLRESHHAPTEVYRLYRAADFCYVGSLRDGMNLVAKEFVCAREDEHGVLILSEQTGAAQQLHEALLINPWAVDSSADAIWQALNMTETEQMNRMRMLRLTVAGFDASWWAWRMLADASSVRRAALQAERLSRAVGLSA
jgi:trehalose 6-phosphate synthase